MTRFAMLGSLFLASAALAQQPPAGSFYETATVQARPLSSATGSVTVIGREEIEASGALTVAELLRTAPGLTITTNGTRGGLTTASIRGGDPNFTLVLLDGVPLNDPVYQEGDVFDLEGLPTDGVERIEIVRGPLSSFYGSTGLAGVIQIFTREGGREGGKTGAQAEVSGGDASFRKGTATVSGILGKAGWSVTALWQEEAERVARERFEQAGGLASFSVPLGPSGNTRLSLKARGTSWEGDDYPDASGGPVLGSGELRYADHKELSLATGLSFGAPANHHELTASVYRHGMERDSPGVFPLVPSSTEETRFTRTRLGWSSVLRTFQGGRWSAGVDAQRESGQNDSLLFLVGPTGRDLIPGDYDISRTVAGAYTELIADRGPWTFELGSRVDVPEEGGTQWSPRLGLGWRPTDCVRVHASAGRAWKLPSFFALASPPALGGNPDLRPEVVVGGDLGADWRLLYGIDAGLTLFYNRYQDLVDFDFDTFTHLNRSEVETRGVEGVLGWHSGDRVSVQASATWQDFEDLTTRAKLRHRPDWTGGLRVLWKPVPRLTLDADAQAVSSFFDEQIPVPERDTVEARTLVGLGGSWRFSGVWELRLRVDNLLGEDYETLIGFPGPDRSVRLGLRWKT